MGLLSLLASPITGPVWAGWWVVLRIAAAAEDELYNEQRIVTQLRALTFELERGGISEREHAAAESLLLDRLREARARRTADEVIR